MIWRFLCLGLLLLAAPVWGAALLSWTDLQPPGFRLNPDEVFGGRDISQISDMSEEGQRLMDQLQRHLDAAPPVQSLEGQRVILRGFALPLVRREGMSTQFFLVPYYGTCIHSPPPPANQIVRVAYPEGVALRGFFASLEVEGNLRLEVTEHRLGRGAYVLDAQRIEPIDLQWQRD